MHRTPATLMCWMALVAACAHRQRPAEGPRLSEQECEALYETLLDEEQGAIKDWFAEVEGAQGTDRYAVIRAQGIQIERRFLPRFQELAERDCDRAKLEVLDFMARLQLLEEDQLDDAIGLLEDLVLHSSDAWWIWDLGDQDIVRYLLLGPQRERAIALFEDFAERTADDEARRNVLLQLGVARTQDPEDAEDREAALRTLDRVVERWPESQEAQLARALLFSERELQVGKPMPALEGHDVDGRGLNLEALRGKAAVVNFFGFWCGPCREGLPKLRALIAQHAEEGFAVLGVNAYDDEATFRRELAALDVSWPCIFDGPSAPLSQALGINVFPVLLIIDREGIIRARNPSDEDMERIVDELVRGEPGGSRPGQGPNTR